MSTFGTLFKVTTFGESHCKGVGAIIDGVPPLLDLTESDIQPQLTRRRPGQSRLTTPRAESDIVTILSGTERGKTLGTPIGLFVPNKNVRPGDYKEMSAVPRPGHADYTYQAKYGIRAASGGGRSSARETIGRVAAGAIAEKFLRTAYGTEIVSFVSSVGSVELCRSKWSHPSGRGWTRGEVDQRGQLQVLRHPQHWARHVSGAADSHADTSGVQGGSAQSGGGASEGPGQAVDPSAAAPISKAASAEQQQAQAAADNTDESAFVAGFPGGAYDAFPCYLAWDGSVLSANGQVLGNKGDMFTFPGASRAVPLVNSANCTDELVPVRCPDAPTAARIASLIRVTKAAHDSIGGTVVTTVYNVPVGLGEPAFDKAEALLAHAMLSLPATKGFEIGSGFDGTRLNGSQHNDAFVNASNTAAGASAPVGQAAEATDAAAASAQPGADQGHVVPTTSATTALLAPSTNNAGGTLGGITSGAPLVFRVAVKPVSTIGRAQSTATFTGEKSTLEAKGRHDPCVLPRTPPLTEAMTALVLADLAVIQASRIGSAQAMLQSTAGQAVQAAMLVGPSMPVLPAHMQSPLPVVLGGGAGTGASVGGSKRPRDDA